MKIRTLVSHAATSVIFSLVVHAVLAADYPAPKEGEWIVRDFRFHTGETLPELRLHYTTVGTPSGQPVLILHGTADQATRFSGSQLFYDTAGSTDKTIKLYEGHFHDLLNDIDKELVIADILSWIDARLPATQFAAQA